MAKILVCVCVHHIILFITLQHRNLYQDITLINKNTTPPLLFWLVVTGTSSFKLLCCCFAPRYPLDCGNIDGCQVAQSRWWWGVVVKAAVLMWNSSMQKGNRTQWNTPFSVQRNTGCIFRAEQFHSWLKRGQCWDGCWWGECLQVSDTYATSPLISTPSGPMSDVCTVHLHFQSHIFTLCQWHYCSKVCGW